MNKPSFIKNWARSVVINLIMVWIVQANAATKEYVGSWNNIIYQDHFNFDPHYLYGFQLDARLRDQPGVLYQILAQGQLGYQVTRNNQVWAGYTALPTKLHIRPYNTIYNQYFYQQLVSILVDTPYSFFRARSRISQFIHADSGQIGWIYREQLFWAISALKIKDKYTPFITDEFFLNINKPSWSNDQTFSKNRLTLGFSFPCYGKHTCQLGYLNQYLPGKSETMINHLLFFSFIV